MAKRDIVKFTFFGNRKVKITGTSGVENELAKDILTEPDIPGDLGLEVG